MRLDPATDPRWDAFVRAHGGHRLHAYHLGAWSTVLRRAYGAQSHYLAVEDGQGALTAALPLVAERGILRRGRLSSLPVELRGGPIAIDDSCAAAVLDAACDLGRTRGAPRVLITTEVGHCNRLAPRLEVAPHAPRWLTPLPNDPEELRRSLRKRSRNLWRNLKKADEAGTVVREARGLADLWRFYLLYAQTVRGRGVLPHSWLEIYFAEKLLGPSGACRVLLVEKDGEIVAGCLFLIAGGTLEALYAGSDPRALEMRPYHAVYWHAIEWAIARGLTTVDWGSATSESSLGQFKAQWADPQPVYRYFYEPLTASVAGPVARPAADADANADVPAGLRERVLARVPVNVLGVASTAAHLLL